MSIVTIDTVYLYAFECPQCKTRCWVNNGDITDQTVSDVEAVYCWKCKHEINLCDDGYEDPDADEEFEEESLIVHPTYPDRVSAVRRDASKASAATTESKKDSSECQ